MAEEPNLNDTILKVKDAHTFICHHHILQGLSFEAKADAVTVLIGRNGAGKSTTLRTVMGLLPPSQGRILYNGKEIQTKRPFEIARMGIGFIPEDMGIFANLTVEENMRVAMLVEDEATGQRLARTLDMFRDFKYSDPKEKGFHRSKTTVLVLDIPDIQGFVMSLKQLNPALTVDII